MSTSLPEAPSYSRAIDQLARAPRRAFQQTLVSLSASEVLEELGDVWQECRVPGWDGYDALRVEHDTYLAAYTLIESLPLGFPPPSIGAEPDGQLTLEWSRSASRRLSVSVDPDGFLHFAGIFGNNRRHGRIALFSSMPSELIRLVQDL